MEANGNVPESLEEINLKMNTVADEVSRRGKGTVRSGVFEYLEMNSEEGDYLGMCLYTGPRLVHLIFSRDL
uniref:Synaptosomal-associated protein n=1 Tax=Steinernema glaseri TaxID=37863 RepID=A0A1I7Y8N8_9BILA